MKKSILIGALAALMLFAFTACAQSPSSPLYGKQVDNIVVEKQPDYVYWEKIYSETINPADLTLRVNFNDGTSNTFTGTELGLTVKSVTGASNVYNVKYNKNLSYDVIVKAYAVESVVGDLSSIDIESFKLGTYQDEPSSVRTNVSFNVTYNGGKTKTVSVSLRNEDVIKAIVPVYMAMNDIKSGEMTIESADLNEYVEAIEAGIGTDVELSFTGSWTVNAIDDATIAYITAKQNTTIYGAPDETNASTVKNTLGEAGIEVTAHYADGHTSVLTSPDWEISFDEYEIDYVFDEANDGIEILVVATKGDKGDADYQKFTTAEHPFKLVVTADYPTAFEVKQIGTEDTNDDKILDEKDAVHYYYNSEPITNIEANFVFTPKTWASGYDSYVSKDDDEFDAETDVAMPEYDIEFTADPSIIPYGWATSTTDDTNGKAYEIPFVANVKTVKSITWAATSQDIETKGVLVFPTEALAKAAMDK